MLRLMVSPLLIAALCLPLNAQIRCGATPLSVTNIMEQALNANNLWEWNAYCEDIGTTNATLSVTGFALDFLQQLQQLTPAEVTDIFTQKVRMSGWGRAAQIAGWVGAGALLISGQSYIAIGAKEVATIGLASYGATQLQPLFVAQEPSVSAAIAGMLTADQVLTPGQGITFKVFASNTGSPVGPTPLSARRTVSKKAKGMPLGPIGPIILTPLPGTLPHAEAAPAVSIPTAPGTSASIQPQDGADWETTLQPASSSGTMAYALLWMRQ